MSAPVLVRHGSGGSTLGAPFFLAEKDSKCVSSAHLDSAIVRVVRGTTVNGMHKVPINQNLQIWC